MRTNTKTIRPNKVTRSFQAASREGHSQATTAVTKAVPDVKAPTRKKIGNNEECQYSAGCEGRKQGADASGKPYNQRDANNSQHPQPGPIIGHRFGIPAGLNAPGDSTTASRPPGSGRRYKAKPSRPSSNETGDER